MTCMKITESQNGQIYPEDTFSHGAAHMFLAMFGKEVGFYYQTLEAIFLLRTFVICLHVCELSMK